MATNRFWGMDDGLQDGFAFGWEVMDVVPDEFLHLPFAFDDEAVSDPGEFMGSGLGHFQCELLHFGPVDQHSSSSSVALYLSCDNPHSNGSTSFLGPRYTGWYRAFDS